ncbi:ABC transporter ATP-binding protein [Desulfitobacterium chlororespirans]|uniref:Branched-chain amino acid transport system ATP-binding protein n=1 Tax=Desulfitobacterium chlororespirans DSM 11544 TaxID=1121395 RepID=A0A1M7SH33_9FIRM|nr:ABC transporter ATP-binding protein [Desulfitobacterium chlororespirans]SHN57785.1 branched-chain amino acid transport system ATP-binding protein [Desulfitobacterium chlororespirans DSM 11544]
MSKAILTLENVDTYYGKIHALKNISFTVGEGEIVTLIGSNGAGKTTTLKTISSLLKPAKGDVVYMGKKVNGLPPHLLTREGIAHVPEGRKIFPRLTVEENLEMGAFSLKDQGRIKHNKEYVFGLFPRLLERRKQKGGTLSGGEQQMLAMGRALMCDPKILLLDEPSMGLAPMMIQAVFNIIKKLRNEGMTILLVEQNAGKALKLANKGYVLQTGSIILAGTGEELLSNDMVRQAYLG